MLDDWQVWLCNAHLFMLPAGNDNGIVSLREVIDYCEVFGFSDIEYLAKFTRQVSLALLNKDQNDG